jgi:hypothetical protein
VSIGPPGRKAGHEVEKSKEELGKWTTSHISLFINLGVGCFKDLKSSAMELSMYLAQDLEKLKVELWRELLRAEIIASV